MFVVPVKVFVHGAGDWADAAAGKSASSARASKTRFTTTTNSSIA